MPKHIYGMHDSGSWRDYIEQAGVTAWVVETTAIGCDPNDKSGQSFGVPGLIEPIVRLNNGYAPAGTIPLPHLYGDFAKRCANFVAASQGCKRWIIGNEIAMTWEYPEGQPITLQNYVQCFRLCREAIKVVQPEAIVIPQPPAPYNDTLKYVGNERGDWAKQLFDMLTMIGIGKVDGIALHTYTHGHDANLITSPSKMGNPFADRHYHFFAYRDFMAYIPAEFRNLPVYITEANPDGWQDKNDGWIQNAYAEINWWNTQPGNQIIECLAFYHWKTEDSEKYHISTKQGVIQDFRDSLTKGYIIPEKSTPSTFDYGYVTAANGLNLRTHPVDGEVIKLLPFATQLVINAEDSGWMHVTVDGLNGWVSNGFVSRTTPRQAQAKNLDGIIATYAEKYDLDPALAKAVFAVEAGDTGFRDEKLLVRFEPRVWLTMTLSKELRETGKLFFAFGNTPKDDKFSISGWWKDFHGNQSLEHLALNVACAIDRDSALKAASYGLCQVMGFNHRMVGYPTVQAMVSDFETGEEAHVKAFFAYCINKRDDQGNALDALKNDDLWRFATLYNGRGQEKYYSDAIRNALK